MHFVIKIIIKVIQKLKKSAKKPNFIKMCSNYTYQYFNNLKYIFIV